MREAKVKYGFLAFRFEIPTPIDQNDTRLTLNVENHEVSLIIRYY